MFHNGNIRFVHAHFCVVTEARWPSQCARLRIELCRFQLVRDFTHAVPLSSQMYNMGTSEHNAGSSPMMDLHLIHGEQRYFQLPNVTKIEDGVVVFRLLVLQQLQCFCIRKTSCDCLLSPYLLSLFVTRYRAAYKWWAESLDTVLNTTDSLKTWRDLTSSSDTSLKPAAVLLQRCGMWGCLLGGVLAADIAQ